jgi:hypothetical protein
MAEPTLNREDETRVIQMAGQLARNATVSRAALAAQLGDSYGDKRNLYEALGYNKTPTFTHFHNRYERQDVAKRVVDFPVAESWRLPPAVVESDEPGQTPFEEAWANLLRDRKVLHYLARVDRVSGIGQYGALLLGYADGTDLARPVAGSPELLYLRPYSQENAGIATWEQKTTSPRFGLPLLYNLKTTLTSTVTEKSERVLQVHHSRVLHIAEGLLEDDVYGTPRLKAVLNRLQDLELVSGGSAEMYWRGGFPGLAFEVDKEADSLTLDTTALQTEIDDYVHALKRYMRLEGINAKVLAAQVADPRGVADVLLSLIAAGTGIPKRKLMGSERGELASTQDEAAWDSIVDTRRRDHCEPNILRPFVDRMIETGNLPPPAGDRYFVQWPPLQDPDQAEQAQTAERWTQALASYANAPAAEHVLPLRVYLKRVWHFEQDEIDAIVTESEAIQDEEDKEIEAARAEEARLLAKAPPTAPVENPT